MSATDKIKKLVALALSPATPQEEARNSAMVALRLIIKNNLLPISIDFKVQLEETKLEEKKEPKKEPAAPTTRKELRELAYLKVGRFIDFLRLKNSSGLTPRYQANFVTDRCLKGFDRHTVTTDTIRVLHYFVQLALREKVAEGRLLSKPGSKGGYWFRVEDPSKPFSFSPVN